MGRATAPGATAKDWLAPESVAGSSAFITPPGAETRSCGAEESGTAPIAAKYSARRPIAGIDEARGTASIAFVTAPGVTKADCGELAREIAVICGITGPGDTANDWMVAASEAAARLIYEWIATEISPGDPESPTELIKAEAAPGATASEEPEATRETDAI